MPYLLAQLCRRLDTHDMLLALIQLSVRLPVCIVFHLVAHWYVQRVLHTVE